MDIVLDDSPVLGAARQVLPLSPFDSVRRALDLLRLVDCAQLPVVDAHERLHGLVGLRELQPLLADAAADLYGPIEPYTRKSEVVVHPAHSLADARARLAASADQVAVVVGEDGRYLGILSVGDLLAPVQLPPAPSPIGGMATPWGVYLACRSLRGGAGNGSLVASGVVLGALLMAAQAAVGLSMWLAQRVLRYPVYKIWLASEPVFAGSRAWLWYLLQALAYPVFGLLIRALPLAGYHAAEHQVVHAMERGEPLEVEVVRRMPRVHPRCGTNLMAAGILFGVVSDGLIALRIPALDASSCMMAGVLAAFFFWRRFGAFLQQWFTTKPATDRQIEAGIAAAKELQSRYLHTGPRAMNGFQRLWSTALPQIAVGVAVGSALAGKAADWFFNNLR